MHFFFSSSHLLLFHTTYSGFFFSSSHLLLFHTTYSGYGLFTLMSFLILPNFDKVTKKVATFSLLPNFSNYIRNHAKILATIPKFW